MFGGHNFIVALETKHDNYYRKGCNDIKSFATTLVYVKVTVQIHSVDNFLVETIFFESRSFEETQRFLFLLYLWGGGGGGYQTVLKSCGIYLVFICLLLFGGE